MLEGDQLHRYRSYYGRSRSPGTSKRKEEHYNTNALEESRGITSLIHSLQEPAECVGDYVVIRSDGEVVAVVDDWKASGSPTLHFGK